MKRLNEGELAALLAPYGLSGGDLTLLGGGQEFSDGIVYGCTLEGRPLALKLMAWTEPAGQFADTCARHAERLRFAGYLLQGGAPVLGPVADGGGQLYRVSYEENCGYISYLMPRAAGRNVPAEEWDEAFLHRWGRAIGRMHRLTAGYDRGFQCTVQDREGDPALGWRNEVRGFYHWCGDEDVKAKWLEVERRLEALPQERGSFGFIHNDPHVQNILDDGQRLSVIDFDVANYHWFVTDISIALQSVLFMASGGMERPLENGKKLEWFLRHLLAGYGEEYALEKSWLTRLDLFLHYRRMLLFTAMQGWLDTQPEARAGWKRMILEEPQFMGPLVAGLAL